MGLLWWTVAIAVAVVWVGTIVDIFRRHYSGRTTAGWILVVLILPFIGSAIYWARRAPPRGEGEQQRLAGGGGPQRAPRRPLGRPRPGPGGRQARLPLAWGDPGAGALPAGPPAGGAAP